MTVQVLVPDHLPVGTIKRCTRCKKRKLVEKFNLDRSRGDGLAAKCRGCCRDEAQTRKVRRGKVQPRAEGTKICPSCEEEKDVLGFSLNPTKPDGLSSTCTACVRTAGRERYKRDPDVTKARTTRARRKRVKAGSTREREGAAAYRARKAGDVRYEMSRRRTDARDRAKKRGLAFDLTVEGLVELWEEQGGCCAVSGIKLELATNGQGEPWLASLDRVDAAGGYVLENVRLVAWMVNRALAGWGDERFLEMCRAVVAKEGE